MKNGEFYYKENKMRTEYTEGELLTREDIGLVFKTRDGIEYKLTALVKEKREGDHVAALVDKNMTDIIVLTKKGKDHDKPNLYKSDLVSFVGSDFTEDKNPIKIEFEACLKDCLNSMATILLADYLKKNNYIVHQFINAKFKFTMEELPN